MQTTIKEVPEGYVLLERRDGVPQYAACLDGGRFHGWLFRKGPESDQWASERKLEQWEVMQAEDQRDEEIVHETPTKPVAPAQEASAEPVAWMRLDPVEFKSDKALKWMREADFGHWAEAAKKYTVPLYAAPAKPVAQADQRIKSAIVAALNVHTTEMEGYSYFGSNPGVKEDDYEEIADEVIAALTQHNKESSNGK